MRGQRPYGPAVGCFPLTEWRAVLAIVGGSACHYKATNGHDKQYLPALLCYGIVRSGYAHLPRTLGALTSEGVC